MRQAVLVVCDVTRFYYSIMSVRFQFLYLETLPDATVTAVPAIFFDTLAAAMLY